MSLHLVRQIADRSVPAPSARDMRRWAVRALSRAGTGDSVRELTVRVVDEVESRDLNRRWRGKDGPTNVLAFPASAPAGVPCADLPLGDLVICGPVLRREAGQQHKSEEAHWCHMIVHGTLHLAGYDHQVPAEAERMESLERLVMADLGYPDPYEAS